MNERIEDLMYSSGLTAQGCWDKLDEYDKNSIKRFGELIYKDIITTVAAQALLNESALDVFKNLKTIYEGARP